MKKMTVLFSLIALFATTAIAQDLFGDMQRRKQKMHDLRDSVVNGVLPVAPEAPTDNTITAVAAISNEKQSKIAAPKTVAILTDSIGRMMQEFAADARDFAYSPFAYFARPFLEGDSAAKWQKKMYNFTLPKFLTLWSKKSDSSQADDLFTVWKVDRKYLPTYNLQAERKRAQKDDFITTDWKGKDDDDAFWYAWCHRRISDYGKTGKGFSLKTMKYYADDLYNHMHAKANKNTIALFKKKIAAYNAPEKKVKKEPKEIDE